MNVYTFYGSEDGLIAVYGSKARAIDEAKIYVAGSHQAVEEIDIEVSGAFGVWYIESPHSGNSAIVEKFEVER